MKKMLTLIMLCCFAFASTMAQNPKSEVRLSETFEDNSETFNMWTIKGEGWEKNDPNYTFYAYEGDRCMQQISETKDTLITPKLNIATGDQIRFWAKKDIYTQTEGVEVIHSTDLITWTSLLNVTTLSGGYINYFVNLNNYTGEGYLAFVSDKRSFIDSVSGPAIMFPDYDVAMDSVDIPHYISIEKEWNFDAYISNIGNNEAEAYTVKLMNDDVELASSTGETIASGDNTKVSINYTPETIGSFDLHLAIVFDEDENLANNNSQSVNVTVLDKGDDFLDIANPNSGGSRGDMPIYMAQFTGISESIYPKEWFNNAGYIKSIEYKKSAFNNELNDVPVKVWMGESAANDLEEAWINTDQLTLVYDGTVDLSTDNEENVTISLAEENYFHYSGAQNLVVFVEKVYSDKKAYNNAFQMTSYGLSKNSRIWYSSTGAIDLSTLNDEGKSTAQVPYTYITLNSNGCSQMNGKITNTQGDSLPSASFAIEGTNYAVTSDSTGQYTIPSLPLGNYTLIAEDFGYYKKSIDFEILEDETLTLDIELFPLPSQSISGSVSSLINSDVIEGAIVSLSGDYEYTTSTDASGNFMFPSVYAHLNYELTVSKDLYADQVQTISLEDVDLVLSTIQLDQMYFPALDLMATIMANDSVLLKWTSPREGFSQVASYKIHRYAINAENKTTGVLIAEGITDTIYMDNTWEALAEGDFQYAVVAVYESQEESEAIFSPTLSKYRYSKVSVQLNSSSTLVAKNAQVTFTNANYEDTVYTGISDETGLAILDNVWLGLYNLEVSCFGFNDFVQASNTISEDLSEITVTLEAIDYPKPNNLSYNISNSSVELSWNSPDVLTPNAYNIIRNDELFIENHSDTTFTDLDLSYGDYTYAVYALYNDGISETTDTLSLTVLEMMPPSDLNATAINYDVTLSWLAPNADYALYEGFEEHEDFSISFDPWTLVDLDSAETFYNGLEYPNNIAPKAYIIYNPYEFSEEPTSYIPFVGDKVATSWPAYGKPSDDWMITPPLHIKANYELNFMARSHTDNYDPALLSIYVGYSTDINKMQLISDAEFECPGDDWTNYSYDLSDFQGENIYIAIRRSGEGVSTLMLDELFVGNLQTANKSFMGYNIYRDGEKVNSTPFPYPFYNEKLSETGDYEYKVSALYSSGESETSNTSMVNITTANIEVDVEQIMVALNEEEQSNVPITITNTGSNSLSYNAEIRYDVWNFNKKSSTLIDASDASAEKLFASNFSTEERASEDDDLLWDNTDIFMGTSGVLSMQFGGLPEGNNLTNGADDFYIEPGISWSISKITAEGWTSEFYYAPEKIGLIIYDDNNGIPGEAIHTEYFNSVMPLEQILELETPIKLQGGQYWISIFGFYSEATSQENHRWNWSTGTKELGFEAMLQDKSKIFNDGNGFSFTGLSNLNLDARSYHFKIEGEETGEPFSWLNLDETSGVIAPTESAIITANFNPEGLEKDNYYEALIILNNSSFNNPDIYIPCQLEILTGVDDFVANNSIVYPNPANNIVYIKGKGIKTIQIIDQAGKVLLSSNNPDQGMDISTLNQGIYFVQVNLNNGSKSIHKLMKQ